MLSCLESTSLNSRGYGIFSDPTCKATLRRAGPRRLRAFDVTTQPLAACEVGDSARVFGDAMDHPKPAASRQARAAGQYAKPRSKQNVRLLQQSGLSSPRRIGR